MAASHEERTLEGVTVLVTRPVHQADRLCKLIELRGGRARRLPALEILDPEDSTIPDEMIGQLEHFDIIIFVSVNAVRAGMQRILYRRDMPRNLQIATVGAGSAKELERFGLSVSIRPEHTYNSEALLALDEMQQVAGKQILIFRGNGGREYLRKSLEARGAKVRYAEVYRRVRPDVDPDDLMPLWKSGAVDIITVSSNETLMNLFDMAGKNGQPLLCRLPLVVVSKRAAVLAARLGFRLPAQVAGNASDDAVLAALESWYQSDARAHESI